MKKSNLDVAFELVSKKKNPVEFKKLWEEVVSVMTSEGESKPVVIKKQISARDRIKAAELIGRRYQLFTDKVNIEGNIGVTIIDDIGVEDD